MPTLPSGATHALESLGDEAILIDLTPPETEHVHPARSRWTALMIAAFTGLTCLGLTATAFAPRLLDRAADRGDPPSRAAPAVSTRPGEPLAQAPAADRTSIAEAKPVVAIARVASAHGASVLVRVTGAAVVSLATIDVALLVGGRVVARETVALDAGATFPGTIGVSRVGMATWTVDLPVPAGATSDGGDERAIVEIGWGPSPAGAAGSDVLVVDFGDGRALG